MLDETLENIRAPELSGSDRGINAGARIDRVPSGTKERAAGDVTILRQFKSSTMLVNGDEAGMRLINRRVASSNLIGESFFPSFRHRRASDGLFGFISASILQSCCFILLEHSWGTVVPKQGYFSPKTGSLSDASY